jgi:hypothetical protein
MHATDTQVEVIAAEGEVLATFSGSKQAVSKEIFQVIRQRLIER